MEGSKRETERERKLSWCRPPGQAAHKASTPIKQERVFTTQQLHSHGAHFMFRLRRDNRRGNSAGGAPPQHCREAEGSQLDDPDSHLPTPILHSTDVQVCFQKAACDGLCNACRYGEHLHQPCQSLWHHTEDMSAMLPTLHRGLFRGILRACIKKDLLPERSDEDRFTPAYKLIGDLDAYQLVPQRGLTDGYF